MLATSDHVSLTIHHISCTIDHVSYTINFQSVVLMKKGLFLTQFMFKDFIYSDIIPDAIVEYNKKYRPLAHLLHHLLNERYTERGILVQSLNIVFCTETVFNSGIIKNTSEYISQSTYLLCTIR